MFCQFLLSKGVNFQYAPSRSVCALADVRKDTVALMEHDSTVHRTARDWSYVYME